MLTNNEPWSSPESYAEITDDNNRNIRALLGVLQ